MLKVLSIGNSFSQDAHRYLHKIARCEGVDMKTVNLYIGGCSLERHFTNMMGDIKDYVMEINGENSNFKVTLKEALLNDSWDIVTLQQASHFSTDYETYTPYIEKLADYIRELRPKAAIFLHQTWAYEQGSEKLTEKMGLNDTREMFSLLEDAYNKAKKAILADGIIPSGRAMLTLADKGVNPHRDTFHADLGVGRYLLGLTWYKALTGLEAVKDFKDWDVEYNEEQMKIAKEIVKEL